MRKNLSLIISFLILILVGCGLFFWIEAPNISQGSFGIAKNSDSKLSKPQGEVTIGGEFDLIDANENLVNQSILQGKYSLVYFGFTSCPSVCPTTLTNITNALDKIGDFSDEIQPIFISVDPKRDTPEVIKEYVSNFHPSFIALTGNEEQTKQAANAFKIYYQAENNGKADYDVGHSDFIYLMDKNGKYITHFTQEDSAEQISIELLRYFR